jgi:hypothetical protein
MLLLYQTFKELLLMRLWLDPLTIVVEADAPMLLVVTRRILFVPRVASHEEIECRQLGRLLVMSGRADRLPVHIKKKIIENFKKHYGIPLHPENNRTACRDLEDWCMARNVSEDEVAAWYDWDAYCAYLEGEESSDATSLEVGTSE